MEQPKKFRDTCETDDVSVNFLGLLKYERKRTLARTSLDEKTQEPSSEGGRKIKNSEGRRVLKLFLVVFLLLCFPIIWWAAGWYYSLFLAPLNEQLGIVMTGNHLLLVVEIFFGILIAFIS